MFKWFWTIFSLGAPDKHGTVWGSAISLFKWRFRSNRRRRYLSPFY